VSTSALLSSFSLTDSPVVRVSHARARERKSGTGFCVITREEMEVEVEEASRPGGSSLRVAGVGLVRPSNSM
jgi:hypothetical protein